MHVSDSFPKGCFMLNLSFRLAIAFVAWLTCHDMFAYVEPLSSASSWYAAENGNCVAIVAVYSDKKNMTYIMTN